MRYIGVGIGVTRESVGIVEKRGRRGVFVGKSKSWKCVELRVLGIGSMGVLYPVDKREKKRRDGRESSSVEEFVPLRTIVDDTFVNDCVTPILPRHLPLVLDHHQKSRLVHVATLRCRPSYELPELPVTIRSRLVRNFATNLSIRVDIGVDKGVTLDLAHLVRLRSRSCVGVVHKRLLDNADRPSSTRLRDKRSITFVTGFVGR